ncbi:MAG: hypothetical protein NVS1B7_7150 [Candidatus Saccharimonadales bacterium]
MESMAEKKEQTYLAYRNARHKLEKIGQATETSSGLKRFVVGAIYRHAEKQFAKTAEQLDAVWGAGTLRPGDITEVAVVARTAHLGVVQADGSIQQFNVPTKWLEQPE